MACSLSQHIRRTASPPRDPLRTRVWAEPQRHSCPLQRQKPSLRKLWCSPHRSQVGTPESWTSFSHPSCLPCPPGLPHGLSLLHPKAPEIWAWGRLHCDCFSSSSPRSPLRVALDPGMAMRAPLHHLSGCPEEKETEQRQKWHGGPLGVRPLC